MTRRLFADLAPGDRFLRTDARTGTDHVCTVLQVGLTASPDALGRTFSALLAEADDGRRGLVSYGPGGYTDTPDTDTPTERSTMPDTATTPMTPAEQWEEEAAHQAAHRADTATVATVRLSVPLTLRFVLDVWENAGPGIRYWAESAEVDESSGLYTVTPDAEQREYLQASGKLGPDGRVVRVGPGSLALALGQVAAGGALRSDLTDLARTALLDIDGPNAAEVDSDLADCLVQLAAFGEVLFA